MQQDNEMIASFAAILGNIAKTNRAGITRDQRLRDDLGLDSLSMIDVVVAAEDEFGITIPDEDAERFATVGDVIDYIKRARAAA